MKIRRVPILIVVVGVLAGLTGFSVSHEMLYLTAVEDLPAYDRYMWSHEDQADLVFSAGQSVPVSSCASDKSDVRLVVHVEGQEYFVGNGNYTLHRRRASLVEAWLSPLATFTCQGLLRHSSQQAPNNSSKPTPLRGAA